MRLTVLHPFAAAAERQDLYASLERLTGWDISLVVANGWRNDYDRIQYAARHEEFNGSIKALPVLGSGNIPLHVYRARLSHEIAKSRPDLVYIYHEPYAVATYQAMVGLPRDVPVGVYSSQNIAKRYPLPFRRMEAWVYRRADFAIAVSQSVASVLAAKGFSAPIRIIPFHVDVDLIAPGPSWPGATSPLRIGYLGRLVQEKGVQYLLDAVARTPNTTVCVAGSGPYEPELRRRADAQFTSDPGRVQWLGMLPAAEVPNFLHTVDVLVVPSLTTPSWKEQFGRVVLEAAAAGVPIITSDSGELPTVALSLGGGAWSVPEGSSAAISSLLSKLAEDNAFLETSKRAVREAAVDRYATHAVTCRLAEVLGEFSTS